jgi:hypothetical protein
VQLDAGRNKHAEHHRYSKKIAQPQTEIHTIQAPSVNYEAMETFKLKTTKTANHNDTNLGMILKIKNKPTLRFQLCKNPKL